MRTETKKLKLAALATVALAGWAATCPAQAQMGYKASLLGSGPLIIPNDAAVNGLTVGGLSGITYAGNNTYYSIVDQGPTNDVASRFYTLNLGVDSTGPHALTGQPVASGVATLRDSGGAAYNGNSFDGEGIALTGSGTVLISSETEPSVREFTLGGAQVQQFSTPSVFNYSATGASGVQSNRGFESLTLTPGGSSFWTANERSLKQDGTLDPLDSAPNDIRLLRYDKTGGTYTPASQFVYNIGAASIPNPSATSFATKGLCDLIAMSDGTLLALERSFYTLGTSDPRGTYGIQLYQISFGGATDVSGLNSLQGQSYTRVTKTLLYDFAGAGFAPDNIEGMTFGPLLENGDRSLVLIADNNFSPAEQTQIVALRLAAAPEPGPVVLFVVGGLLLAVRTRRRSPR